MGQAGKVETFMMKRSKPMATWGGVVPANGNLGEVCSRERLTAGSKAVRGGQTWSPEHSRKSWNRSVAPARQGQVPPSLLEPVKALGGH